MVTINERLMNRRLISHCGARLPPCALDIVEPKRVMVAILSSDSLAWLVIDKASRHDHVTHLITPQKN